MENSISFDFDKAAIYCCECEQEVCRICERCPACDGCDESEDVHPKTVMGHVLLGIDVEVSK